MIMILIKEIIMLPYMTGITLTVIALRASRAACLRLGTERDGSTVTRLTTPLGGLGTRLLPTQTLA